MIILPRLDTGGAEKVMMMLADNIDRSVFKIFFVVLDKQGVFAEYTNPHIEIIDLKCKRVRYSILKIRQIIAKVNPEVVLSTLGHLNLLIMLIRFMLPKGIKFIAREASIPSFQNNMEKHSSIFNVLYPLLYKKFDLIICQSKAMANDLNQHFGIPMNKLSVINNPVNYDSIREYMNMKIDDIPRADKMLVTVGRLSKEKGYDYLLKAVSLLRDRSIRLMILGDGPEYDDLSRLADDLGIQKRVHFMGFQHNPHAYVKKADVFVLSSRYEGFPNVVLESFACGIPVVAFDCPGGTSEIVRDGFNGFLVPPEDCEMLAQAIEKAFTFHFDRDTIIEDVKCRFDIHTITHSYETALLSVLA
jgi:glycosyltransferase involved in cell wall biosynthesis